MNPLLIVGGVYLSSRIISYIAGELTQEEIEKQNEINEIIADLKRTAESYDPANDDAAKEVISNEVKKKVEKLIQQADSRIREFSDFTNEIKDSKRQVVFTLNDRNALHINISTNLDIR